MKSDSEQEDRPVAKTKTYTIKYKRPRGSRACTVCRARKVRCDAEIHIPCTNCITFGCECVLPETKKRSSARVHVKKGSPLAPEHPKEAPQDATSESSSYAPQSAGTAASINTQTLEPIHNISQVSVPPSLTSDYKNRPSMHKREMLASSARTSVTFLGSSSISVMALKIGQNHLELASDLYDVPDSLNSDSVELEILKLRGAFLLPDRELALDLINLYFEHVHPLMPVINRTEFMAKFEDPNDSPPLMLLQAVLLCGSRVSNNPLLFDSKGLSDLASLTFFRRAKALYETNYESDPISIVQTVILIGSFWEGPEDVTRNSYYWTRVAIGLAQGFGFHRDVSALSLVSPTNKKIWRRIWWCLFEKDRNVSIAFGRPIEIDLTDCDVPMLVLDDFDESDPESGTVSPYPINETQALYFIHLVKLAEITGVIIKHQYTVKAEQRKRVNKFSVIQRCDMLMGIWFANLPPQLQFSLTDSSKQNFYGCLLNAQYYNRLYLIHRANLLRMARSSSTNPNNYRYPSWGISFQAARMISIISKILLDKGMMQYCPVMFVYILFSSLIMLIYHVDSTNPAIASTASDSLFISRGVLKELSRYWPIVDVLLRLFDKYANDKFKRAQMIEKGEIIAHMEDSKEGRAATTGVTGPVSPEGGDEEDNQMNDNLNHIERNGMNMPTPVPASSVTSQGTGSFPATEHTAKDHNGVSERNPTPPGTQGGQSAAQGSNPDNTPSSVHSFPDILLVTEAYQPNISFVENFQPTQLFPVQLNSRTASRAQSPAPNPFARVKLERDFNDNAPLRSAPGSTTNLTDQSDFLTNFVDNSYLDMNLQSNADVDGLFGEDMGIFY